MSLFVHIADAENRRANRLFKSFCLVLAVGHLVFALNLFRQFKAFAALDEAMLREQAGEGKLHESMLARTRLRIMEIERVHAMVQE